MMDMDDGYGESTGERGVTRGTSAGCSAPVEIRMY